MKINLPNPVILECMELSPKFREYALGLISSQDGKQQIENVFLPLLRSGQKIEAIKALRTYSRNDENRLFTIKNAFPVEFAVYETNCGSIMTLASAQIIVELYA
jgi:hypothetical protein